MRRLTAILLGVFAFVLILGSTADACPLGRVRARLGERHVQVERHAKVERERHGLRVLPLRGCAGGACPVR